jgi:putative ABC transport system substrate-binding protein
MLFINLDLARELNVNIPQELVDRADIIVRNGQEVKR